MSCLSRPTFAGAALCAAALAVSTPAAADFIAPDGVNAPWVRGVTANSAWAQWESFASAAGPNAPTAGSYASGPFADGSPAWNASDIGGASLVTGAGNIYSPGGPLMAQIDVPNYGLGDGFATTILLQVRTQGTEVSMPSVNIGGIAAVQVTELYREALGGFGGFIVDTLWRFELAGNAAGYQIRFDALGPHMSLDRVAVDSFSQVPAPGVAALLCAGALVPAGRRRKA